MLFIMFSGTFSTSATDYILVIRWFYQH